MLVLDELHREGLLGCVSQLIETQFAFKPDNAMVDRSGRVQVLDFGLAASAGPAVPPTGGLDSATHAFVGTPAYMSPEQYAGGRADARSDQFAPCVALFEAIHGQRPFVAETLPALAASVTSGTITKPTKPQNVDHDARSTSALRSHRQAAGCRAYRG